VAPSLLQAVMRAEKKSIINGVDRKYLLDTYAERLAAVKAPPTKSRMQISKEATDRLGVSLNE
jgi:hypothetical protein